MISVRSGKSIVINDHEKMASNATQNLQKNTDISKINLNSAKLRTVKNKKMTKQLIEGAMAGSQLTSVIEGSNLTSR